MFLVKRLHFIKLPVISKLYLKVQGRSIIIPPELREGSEQKRHEGIIL